MKNIDIIRNFGRGATSGKVGNLKIEGDNLINYWTVIATRENGGIALNSRKYSASTSRIQNIIRKECNIVREFEGKGIYA